MNLLNRAEASRIFCRDENVCARMKKANGHENMYEILLAEEIRPKMKLMIDFSNRIDRFETRYPLEIY